MKKQLIQLELRKTRQPWEYEQRRCVSAPLAKGAEQEDDEAAEALLLAEPLACLEVNSSAACSSDCSKFAEIASACCELLQKSRLFPPLAGSVPSERFVTRNGHLSDTTKCSSNHVVVVKTRIRSQIFHSQNCNFLGGRFQTRSSYACDTLWR